MKYKLMILLAFVVLYIMWMIKLTTGRMEILDPMEIPSDTDIYIMLTVMVVIVIGIPLMILFTRRKK